MKSYSPREMRTAVLVAVVLTAIAVVALFDPSCQPRTDVPHTGAVRSIVPK